MKNGEVSAVTRQGTDWSRIDQALDRGLYLQLDAEVDAWIAEGSEDSLLRAVRALRYLGAERVGDAITLRLARRHRHNAMARVSMLRTRLYNRGAFAYWRTHQRWPEPAEASPQARAEALSVHGLWLADLRDFERARQAHDQALALVPDDPWLHVEFAYTLQRQDLYTEALAAIDRALELHPGYRAALQSRARVLTLLQRQDEAIEGLTAAVAHSQCGAVAMQLADLLYERGDYDAALAQLAAAETWMPRADKSMRAQLAARRADVLLRLDRYEDARGWALQVPGTGFYAELAERLATAPEGPQRVLLKLAFVRQHWATCAPATLTALSHYWGWEAEHLEVAQAICYDGTTDVNERLWSEGRGFRVREFRLDWPTACALLDAGVPFALVTQHAGGGHLQAVVGYDRLRQTLLIRDPFQPHHAEFVAAPLFEGQAAQGPRAMLMLPPEELHRLDGITLPEADDWDHMHRLQAALERHDRAVAQAALQTLQAQAPDSRLYWRAARQLALYDGNEPAILEATNALLEKYPQDSNLQMSKVASLVELEGQVASERFLETLVDRPYPEPLLMARLADRLGTDQRQMPRAWSLISRALRRAPSQGRLWWQWADFEWNHGDRLRALDPYRWASCLMPTDEGAARAYMRACAAMGQPAVGLAFLRAREAEWGDRSCAPLITLHEQLDLLERADEAQALIDAGLRRRPDDAHLKLYAAEQHLRRQRLDEAQALVEAAVQPTRQGGLLRLQALLAEARGDFDTALGHAREACALEPFSISHQRILLRLLSRRQGRAAAVAHLTAVAARHPAHYALQRLLLDWLPDEPAPINAQLARLVEHHPKDGWVRRQRALQASRQGRHDDALLEASIACELNPERAEAHGTLGSVLLARDGYAAAEPSLRRALTLDVDYDYGMRTLINAAPDATQARAAVDLAAAELQRQPVLGDALLCFQSTAWRGWDAAAISRRLWRLLRQRPDVWEAWVALGRQWIETGRAGRARRLLMAAAQRFTGLPRVQLELAEALRQIGDRAGAMQAVQAALALSPGWNRAVRVKVDLLHETGGDWAEAEQVVQRALHHAHEDDDLIGLLAWIHERQNRDDDALAQARRSLLLDPRPQWIWQMVRRICARTERWDAFDALLAEVERSRPGDAWAWTVQAQHGRDDEAAVVAAEQAIALSRTLEAAWLARFERLARLFRHAEIETLMQSLPWPAQPPLAIAAWGARVLWRRGEGSAACERLHRLLMEQPGDELLWRELADWCDERDDHAGYLEAARQTRALSPHRAVNHAYVGHALYKLKQPVDAIEPLQRAVALDATYGFAARVLCLAATDAGRYEVADAAMLSIWPHEATPAHAAMAIRAAAQAKDQARAMAWLDRLASLDDYDFSDSRRACASMQDAGWQQALQARLLTQIERGNGPPGLAYHWLEQEAKRFGGQRAVAWRVGPLLRRAQGPLLARALLRWLTDTEQGLALRTLVARHDGVLRADAQTWGEVSFALLTLDRHAAVIRWLRDWRDRPQAPIFALTNLCLALATKQRWSEIGEILARALPRAPYQEDLRLWQLVLLARDGDAAQLDRQLARRHEWTPDDWMPPLISLIEAYAEVLHQRGGGDSIAHLRRAALPDGIVQTVWKELKRTARWRHTAPGHWWRWSLPL